jgi:hypothetical protein
MQFQRVNGLWLPMQRKPLPKPTIITAYLDESEDENRPRNERVSAIGGLVGNTDNWRGFSQEWRSVMDGHGLTGVTFHTVDFEGGYSEPWKSLKNDRERRESLLNGLLEVIQRNRVMPYGVLVLVGEFDAMEEMAKKKWSVPYKLCFDQAILKLVEEFCEIRPGDRVQCVFDDNEKYRGWGRSYYKEFVEEYPKYRDVLMEDVLFSSRRESAEMEAADLFAYELRKMTYNGLQDPNRNLRYGFRQMIRPGRGIWRIDLSQVIPEDRRIHLANEDA